MRISWGKGKSAEEAPPSTPAPAQSAPPAEAQPGRTPRARSVAPATPAPATRSLAQVLLDEGAVPRDQLEAAIAKQKADGGFLVEILIGMGVISENSLTSFLVKHCKIPHLSLLDYLIDKDIVKLVPEEICLKHRLIPIDKMGRNLTVAMVNPLDAEALATVQAHVSDLRIKPILCAHSHYQQVIGKVFSDTGAATSGMAEMSMTDLGLGPASGAKKATKPAAPEAEAAPPPAPAPEPVAEAIPEPPPAPAPEPIIEAIPEPEPVEAPKAPDAATSDDDETLDGDSILQAFMTESPQESAATQPAAPAGDSSSMMQEMFDVMQSSMRDTYAVLARRIEVFRGLTPEEVAKVFASGMSVEYNPGDVIFQKGDKSDDIYVVIGGKVEVRDGDRVIATLVAGEVLGEMAWISDEPRSATAVATESVSLVTLSDAVFESLVSKEAAIQLLMNIILLLTERIRRANDA